jgi:hypothetical protein
MRCSQHGHASMRLVGSSTSGSCESVAVQSGFKCCVRWGATRMALRRRWCAQGRRNEAPSWIGPPAPRSTLGSSASSGSGTGTFLTARDLGKSTPGRAVQSAAVSSSRSALHQYARPLLHCTSEIAQQLSHRAFVTGCAAQRLSRGSAASPRQVHLGLMMHRLAVWQLMVVPSMVRF